MPLSDRLLAPISAESPGGVDVAYEADYSRIAALRDVRNPEHDPEEVVSLTTRLLEERSKDLTLAIWLSEATLALEGFGGLDEGLHLVLALVDGFWEHLYPKGLEDRAFALEFLGEGFTARDDKYEPIKFVAITDWGHNLHQFDEWKGLRKDSFAGDDAGAKKKKQKGEDADDDPRAPTSANFESGFAETPKARYKDLRAHLTRCTEAVGALEERVKERFVELRGPKPSFGKLKESLGRATTAVQVLLDKKLELEPDPVAAAAPEPGAAESGDAPGAASGDAAAPNPAAAAASARAMSPDPSDAEDAHRRVATAARYLRRLDPTDPAPYLLVRGLRWGELRKGGRALDVRLLDAPPTDLRKRLKTLVLNGAWAELLEAGEDVMATPSGRGWLDLQRYVLTALEGLGSAYAPVADAVRTALAALLRDVPGLLNATLMDDTPTANAETVEWLGLQGLTGDAAVGSEKGAAPDYDSERILSEATHEKALEWVASGNPMRGVELLRKRAEREQSARARFITQSLAASVLVDAGMLAIARPMLEDLVELVNTRNLDAWEAAAVVARPVGLLYRCLPDGDGRRGDLYDLVCRLDPLLAVSLQQEAEGAGAQPDAGSAGAS
jgi:type VI secretion system protein ImpA